MSMFHELMMRKKEEIMYATIKGTLTENDGVFSGFSSSNYLQLQQNIDTSKPFEISTKFNLSSLNSNSTILSSSAYQMVIRVNTSNKIDMLLTSSTTWDIAQATGTTILSANTNYWIKFKFTGTQYQILLSTDGINYTTEISVNSSLTIASMPYIDIGYRGNTNTHYFRGSIDLPNSYIKIDNTKYNLQAVVGYTVVGSPTIVDGVVSGFSSANYLSLTTSPNLSEETEIVTKINRNSNNNVQFIMGWKSDGVYSVGLYLSAGKIIVNYQRSADGSNQRLLLGTKVYDGNTDYYIKLIKTNNSLSIFYSINGKNWEQDAIAEFTDMPSFAVSRFRVGVGADTTPNAPFDGSIYINETYIKIDNKLWFNGQQA